MSNEWILDVLADLKTFARTNGMLVLADQLDDAVLVAASEIASLKKTAQRRDAVTPREDNPRLEAGDNA